MGENLQRLRVSLDESEGKICRIALLLLGSFSSVFGRGRKRSKMWCLSSSPRRSFDGNKSLFISCFSTHAALTLMLGISSLPSRGTHTASRGVWLFLSCGSPLVSLPRCSLTLLRQDLNQKFFLIYYKINASH